MNLAEVVDMSGAQPADSDFVQAKQSGLSGTWFKATEGVNFTDGHFYGFCARAKAAGLPYGAYHYLRVRPKGAEQDASTQAAQFCEAYRKGGCNLPPMIDVESEENTQNKGVPIPNAPGEDEFKFALKSFISKVSDLLGIPVSRILIYTSPGEWASFGLSTATEFNECELWVADTRGRASPEVPPPFKTWRLWQYTWSAKVPGIASAVDKSKFAGTPDGFLVWAGLSSGATMAGAVATGAVMSGIAYGLYRLWQWLGR